jgi:hypothetical protein
VLEPPEVEVDPEETPELLVPPELEEAEVPPDVELLLTVLPEVEPLPDPLELELELAVKPPEVEEPDELLLAPPEDEVPLSTVPGTPVSDAWVCARPESIFEKY